MTFSPQTPLLLLPAFNEEDALQKLIPAAHAVNCAVLVVNDGSTDRTEQVALNAGARVINHPRNLGLATGIRTLLNAALQELPGEHDVIVMMDGDGTMQPAQIPAMLEVMRVTGADVVIASRFRPGAREEGVSLPRRVYSRGCAALFGWTHPVAGVRDYTCGFRVMRVGPLRELQAKVPHWFDAPGFSAGTELLIRLAEQVGVTCAEVPLILRYDEKPTASKMNVGRTVREYLRLMTTRFVSKQTDFSAGQKSMKDTN